MKIAMLFAGQGSQYPGMGKDLYDNYERARIVFDNAGERVKNWCFKGSKELLMETDKTQPCVYTVTMAAYYEFEERLQKLIAGKESDSNASAKCEIVALAGFSLGEYSALTAAGVIKSITDGIDIMEKRGHWMAEAGKNEAGENIGRMAAVMAETGKIEALVEKTREDGILVAANYNSPSQTVVSGDRAAIERFINSAKEEKVRVIELAVGSAFHSPMMGPASEKIRNLILSKELGEFKLPVYSNVTAAPMSKWRMKKTTSNTGELSETSAYNTPQTKADIADIMAVQLISPVRWADTVNALAEAGVDTMIEFGPGKTLTGLVKKTRSDIKVYNVENFESLEETLKIIGEEINC